MLNASDILDGLNRSPAILSAFATEIPGHRMNQRRGKDFWTIAEHLSHLAQVQPMLLKRLERFVGEDRPVFVPYIPVKDAPDFPKLMPLDESLEKFSRVRDQQIVLLHSFSPSLWAKQADHPEYELYTPWILARHILLHDSWHMYRMEELWLTKDAYLTELK